MLDVRFKFILQYRILVVMNDYSAKIQNKIEIGVLFWED